RASAGAAVRGAAAHGGAEELLRAARDADADRLDGIGAEAAAGPAVRPADLAVHRGDDERARPAAPASYRRLPGARRDILGAAVVRPRPRPVDSVVRRYRPVRGHDGRGPGARSGRDREALPVGVRGDALLRAA